MADFKVELTEQEIIQIIAKHIEKEYGFEHKKVSLEVAWKGPIPTGASIFHREVEIVPRTKIFE